MLNNLRKTLEPFTNLIATPFIWIHPDILSFFSFVVAIPGFYFLATGESILGSLFALGAAFDMVDGTVARKTGKTSKFGGVLDATLDRIFEGLLVLFMGIGELVEWEILVIFLIFSVTVSYIKAKAEAAAGETTVGTNKFSVGIAQRGERILLVFLGLIINGLVTPDGNEIIRGVMVLLCVLVVITSIWRGVMIRKILAFRHPGLSTEALA